MSKRDIVAFALRLVDEATKDDPLPWRSGLDLHITGYSGISNGNDEPLLEEVGECGENKGEGWEDERWVPNDRGRRLAKFIAAAPRLILQLAKEVQRLRKRVDELEATHEAVRDATLEEIALEVKRRVAAPWIVDVIRACKSKP